jgi:hypothetical protein
MSHIQIVLDLNLGYHDTIEDVRDLLNNRYKLKTDTNILILSHNHLIIFDP